MTRLRFVVKDAEKVDTEGIKQLNGVLDLVLSSGQHQVGIGPKVTEPALYGVNLRMKRPFILKRVPDSAGVFRSAGCCPF